MSPTQEAAMRQALEALEMAQMNGEAGLRQYETFEIAESIKALKAALAERQEPVAWALHTGTKQGIKWNRRVEHGTPLYTTPLQRSATV